MSWSRIGDSKDISDFTRRFKRRAKFLVDENVIPDVAEWLRDEGWNVRDVNDLGISGRDDRVVFQAAREHGRMLITHDEDFLDNREFPFRISPGIIVIPGGDGNYEAMARAVVTVVRYLAPYGEIWLGTKIEIHSESEAVNIKVTSFTQETGAIEVRRFRLRGGHVDEWATA